MSLSLFLGLIGTRVVRWLKVGSLQCWIGFGIIIFNRVDGFYILRVKNLVFRRIKSLLWLGKARLKIWIGLVVLEILFERLRWVLVWGLNLGLRPFVRLKIHRGLVLWVLGQVSFFFGQFEFLSDRLLTVVLIVFCLGFKGGWCDNRLEFDYIILIKRLHLK